MCHHERVAYQERFSMSDLAASTQDHQPRGGTAHNELGPATSFTGTESGPQTCPQARPVRFSSQLRTLTYVKLTTASQASDTNWLTGGHVTQGPSCGSQKDSGFCSSGPEIDLTGSDSPKNSYGLSSVARDL